MKIRLAALACACAATALSAPPTAVERGVVVQGGLQFQKSILLDSPALADQGKRLEKGTYDVHFESLAGNKVRASFFQGGTKRGEAIGIIIVGGSPAHVKSHVGGASHAPTFSELGLGAGTLHTFRKQGDKLSLVVGQGTNEILIGLLQPAALLQHGAIAPQQRRR